MSGQPGPQDLSELNADGRRMVRDAATIGGLRTALADCIALLDTFAEVAQERGETVDWAMLSVMADKHRPLIVSDDEIKRQAESLGRNDSRGERQAVLK